MNTAQLRCVHKQYREFCAMRVLLQSTKQSARSVTPEAVPRCRLFLSTHLTKPSLVKHRQSDQPTGKLALPTIECVHADVRIFTIFLSKALPM